MSDKIKLSILIDKKKAARNITLVVAIAVVLALAYFLHVYEPQLPYSELVKVITGAFVLIGIIYSIMTYELAQKKNHHDMHMQKISATYNAASQWFAPQMLECTRLLDEFKKTSAFLLLKTDAKAFEEHLDEHTNSNRKKALLGLFNYFESIAIASNENMMDEDFVKKYFKGVFTRYYNDYLPYIQQRRMSRQNPGIWSGFTSLVEKWK